MKLTKEEFENLARPLAEKLIDHAKTNGEDFGITDVKVAIYNAREESTDVTNGQISEAVIGEDWSVGITLYAGNRMMAFGKNTLDFDDLAATIDANMKVIHIVPENADKRLLESNKVYKGEVDDLDLFDQAPPTHEQMVDFAKKVEEGAHSVDGVKSARGNSFGSQYMHALTIATNGIDKVTSKTKYQAGISIVAEDESGMQIDGNYCMARHFADLADPFELGREAAENAVAKLGATLPTSKEASIILSPDAARTFFSSLLQAIDGTSVYREATFMKDKVGEQVMNESITIEDDPHIKRAFGSYSTDSAGIKTEKLTFIEKGVLKQFAVDLDEARKLGLDPIGREDGFANLKVLPGDQSPDDLMADIRDGFYIKGFQGGTANVNNGQFSRQAYGSVIKDGKITDEAVAGFVVSGNLKDMFMKAVVADDTPELPNPHSTSAIPTTRIDGIKIAGR